MKKLLVVSDTHFMYDALESAVEQLAPDMVIHLGDGFEEAQRLAQEHFSLPVVKLTGNCDYHEQGPSEYLDEMEGVRIYACHGHRYHVKSGLLALGYAAQERGVQLCLYGHTHIAALEENNGITFLNPGACSGRNPSCALVTLDKGKFECRFVRLQ